MNAFNCAIIGLLAIFSSYIQLLSYNRLSGNNKIVISKKIIIVSILSGIIIAIVFYNNGSVSRIVLNMLVLMISALIVFNDKLPKVSINTIMCFIIMLLFELATSFILVILHITNLSFFDENMLLKIIYSLINVLILFYITGRKKIQRLSTKINSFIGKNNTTLIVSIIILIVFALLDYKMVINGNKKIYFTNILIIICFTLIIGYGIYNNIKSLKEVKKTETLLNFISTYENKIDEDRINRHEMLNNLLILKSIKNKNSKEFNDTLDDLIRIYDKKGMGIKNISKLPTGLKGMVYYKLEEVQKKKIKVNINISKQISLNLEKLNHKEYALLCKTVGITLDNAIEAADNSKEKMLNIDIYKENENIIIMIDNSFSKQVDIRKIGTKNYSTKGKGRGLGLYIIKNLLKTSNNLILEQKIENQIFNSKIIVKQN
jgi:two-component system, LytTR family, sensor histidine kinase AgrC